MDLPVIYGLMKGDESQSCPPKSPRVPPNMVQYECTIVRGGGGENVYRTKRLALVLTPAEKAAVVQMAEDEGGLSQSALVWKLIRNVVREHGIWPPKQPRHTITRIEGLQHGRP